jgi:hypothetical protein
MGDDAEPIEATAASTDARGAMRLAQIEADQAHGEQLLQRYGRTELRQRFAVLGHANMKQRRRRR